MSIYYIGADVHSNSTELAIEKNGEIVQRYSVPTTIPAISHALDSLGGTLYMAVEEGPMSSWLYRNLHEKLDGFISSDPRRNKWIASDGDKDDKIDAGKLAALLRGGFLRPVHQSDDDRRVELKHWVGLYHDRVRDAVRTINKIRARCRMHGIKLPRAVLRDSARRQAWLQEIDCRPLANQITMLWMGYDVIAQQTAYARRQMIVLSKPYAIIKSWGDLPGIGLIRAATIFAYLDTPWRFKKKSKLWKYCGIGLERATSGTDKKGNPKPTRLRLPWSVNPTLKNAVLGAALSAITHTSNGFKEYYDKLTTKGVLPSNARHAVARKLTTVLWAMWKTSASFDERLLECKD